MVACKGLNVERQRCIMAENLPVLVVFDEMEVTSSFEARAGTSGRGPPIEISQTSDAHLSKSARSLANTVDLSHPMGELNSRSLMSTHRAESCGVLENTIIKRNN